MRRQLVMIADDVIDLLHRLPLLRRDLRRAAGDDDSGLRIVAARAANGLACLPFGFGRDGACVENDGVIEPGFGGLIPDNL